MKTKKEKNRCENGHAVRCPYCGSENIVLYGKSAWSGKQRYLCRNPACSHKTFRLEYDRKAFQPGVKEQAVQMMMDGANTADISRVLGISKDTVKNLRKKRGTAESSR